MQVSPRVFNLIQLFTDQFLTLFVCFRIRYISYPRTETNIFPKDLNLTALVEQQTPDPHWGSFAQSILERGGPTPRNGNKSDQAHPPIHPTKYTSSLQVCSPGSSAYCSPRGGKGLVMGFEFTLGSCCGNSVILKCLVHFRKVVSVSHLPRSQFLLASLGDPHGGGCSQASPTHAPLCPDPRAEPPSPLVPLSAGRILLILLGLEQFPPHTQTHVTLCQAPVTVGLAHLALSHHFLLIDFKCNTCSF